VLKTALKSIVSRSVLGCAGETWNGALCNFLGSICGGNSSDCIQQMSNATRAMFDERAVSGQVKEWNPQKNPYRKVGAVEALFTMATRKSTFPFLYSGSLATQGTRTPSADGGASNPLLRRARRLFRLRKAERTRRLAHLRTTVSSLGASLTKAPAISYPPQKPKWLEFPVR
jgi:hypothetical protein